MPPHPPPGIQVTVRLPRWLVGASDHDPHIESDLRGFVQTIYLPGAALGNVTLRGDADIRPNVRAAHANITSAAGGIFGAVDVQGSAHLTAMGGPIVLAQLGLRGAAGADNATTASLRLGYPARPGSYILAAAALRSLHNGTEAVPGGGRFAVNTYSAGRPVDLRVEHAGEPGGARAFRLAVKNAYGPLNVEMSPAYEGAFAVQAGMHMDRRATVVDTAPGWDERKWVREEDHPEWIVGRTWVGDERSADMADVQVLSVSHDATLVI